MASLLSVGGLSTGIDTKTLLDQLIEADRGPQKLVQAKRNTAQAQLEAIKQMNTRLLALRDSMDDLELGDAFAKRSASSSSESVMTATAGDGAQPGGATLTVKHLASAHQVATAQQPSATVAAFTSGSITLQSAGATTATVIPVSDYSLKGLAAAINGAKAGATASVINDGGGYRLLVSSTKTGADQGITQLQADGDLAGLLGGVGSMTVAAPARNALMVIGDPDTGLAVESATNTADQVLPGVTLALKSAGTTTITVESDAAGVRSAAQSLADAFNNAQAYLKANGSYDKNTKRAGPLFSEYDLVRQLDTVENRLTQAFAAQPAGFKRLSDIGMSIGTDGKLAIDAEVFESKVAENSEAVSSLFLAVGSAASAPLEGLTRSVDGSMALKQSRLEDSIAAFNQRIAAYDVRLEARRALYQAQFLQMEKVTAQLQSQGTALTSFVSGLTKSK